MDYVPQENLEAARTLVANFHEVRARLLANMVEAWLVAELPRFLTGTTARWPWQLDPSR